MNELKLWFGLLSGSLVEQIKKQDLEYVGKNDIDKLNDYVNRIRMSGLISDGEWHKINKRFMKYISKNVR